MNICKWCNIHFVDDNELETHEQYQHGGFRVQYHLNHKGAVNDIYKKYYIDNYSNNGVKILTMDVLKKRLTTIGKCPLCGGEVTRILKYWNLCEVCENCSYEKYTKINQRVRGVKTGNKRGNNEKNNKGYI